MFYLYFSMLSWCFLKLDSLYHVPKRAQNKTLASCKDASLFLLGQNILNMFLDSCSGEFKVADADARQIQANAGHFLDNPHDPKPNQDTLLQMTRDVVAHGNLKHLLASVLNLRHHAKAHGPMLHQCSTNGSEVIWIQIWKE